MTEPITSIDRGIDASEALSIGGREVLALPAHEGRPDVALIAINTEVVLGTMDGQYFIRARLSVRVCGVASVVDAVAAARVA